MAKLRIQVDKTLFVEYKTKMAPEDFQNFIRGFLKWQVEQVTDRIKEVVDRQVYSWSPLSPSWVQFKSRMGLSPKTWYASGQVMDAVHYWYVPLGDQWFIGVHPTKRHRAYMKGGGINQKKKGARIIDIIKWMEHGTTRMPPRPLFSKVLGEFRSKSKQTKLYAEYIKSLKGLS
jgi:hypothetical protein